jgi:VanZ family protein
MSNERQTIGNKTHCSLLIACENWREWILLIIYTLLILITLPLMPWLIKIYYKNLSFPLSSVCYIISLIVFLAIIGYLKFIRKESRISVYLWFFALSSVYALLIFRQKLPAEKFHFFEYGLFSYFSHNAVEKDDILARLLRFKNSYLMAFILILVVSSIDEFIQHLLPNRVGELSDVILNIISGILGLMTIGLVLRRNENLTTTQRT